MQLAAFRDSQAEFAATGVAPKVNAYGTPEELQGHIRHTLSLNLPELQPALCSHDGTFVIAGSGPSLPDFVDEIKEEVRNGRPVCAINDAHDFLREKGVEPTFFLSLDPRPGIASGIKKKSDSTIYLLSSRCHAKVYEKLGRDRVIVWHSLSHPDEMTIFDGTSKILIGGCSTSGLRAINVAYYLGFRKFVLYGIDSCLGKDGVSKRFNGAKAGQILEYKVGQMTNGKPDVRNARVFKANWAMGNQAAEFNRVYQMMPDVHIEARGDGLIAAMIEQRKEMGLPT